MPDSAKPRTVPGRRKRRSRSDDARRRTLTGGPGRATRRPARAGAPAASRSAPRSAVASRGRVVVLLLVVAGLAISAVLPLRTYLEQRSAINALHSQITQERASVSDMQVEAARWQDPVFVRAQARARLRLVAPGETDYIVLDSAAAVSSPTSPTSAPSADPGATTTPALTGGPGPGASSGQVRPGAPDGATGTTPGASGVGDPGRAVAGLGSANPLWAISLTPTQPPVSEQPPTSGR